MSKTLYPIQIDGVFMGMDNNEHGFKIMNFTLELPYNRNRWHKHPYTIEIKAVMKVDSELKNLSEWIILGSCVNLRGKEKFDLIYGASPICGYRCLYDEEIEVLKNYIISNEGTLLFELKQDNYRVLKKEDTLVRKSFW